jgi:hypothetical protein
MTETRNFIFAIVVFVAPVVVAWWGLSVPAAAGIVIPLLLCRWLMPEGCGGGKADPVRIEREQTPVEMRRDVERWIIAFPGAVSFVENLYRTRQGEAP